MVCFYCILHMFCKIDYTNLSAQVKNFIFRFCVYLPKPIELIQLRVARRGNSVNSEELESYARECLKCAIKGGVCVRAGGGGGRI